MKTYNTFDTLALLVREYFNAIDYEKKFPNAGFTKPRRSLEKQLRKIVNQWHTNQTVAPEQADRGNKKNRS